MTNRSALPGPFLPKGWMGACDRYEDADWVLVGLPYDGTTSFRPGTRFGPSAIRDASWGLEFYSPLQHKTLEAVRYYDARELDFPMGNRDITLQMIRDNAVQVIRDGKRWLGLGGEHLVTLPVIEAYVQKYPDLGILHFDAHTDLREDYLGERLSHATVLRRCVELISPDRLIQIGIRSGPEDEFAWMRRHQTLLEDESAIPRALDRLQGRPVFLTIDLDVLDPSLLCGTGTPEPGGHDWLTFTRWLKAFQGLNFVGADVVELSPHYDVSGVSSVVAAKAVREVLLLNAPEMAE